MYAWQLHSISSGVHQRVLTQKPDEGAETFVSDMEDCCMEEN